MASYVQFFESQSPRSKILYQIQIMIDVIQRQSANRCERFWSHVLECLLAKFDNDFADRPIFDKMSELLLHTVEEGLAIAFVQTPEKFLSLLPNE